MSFNSQYVKVGGVWKPITSLQVQVGGVWKPATSGQVQVGGVWKSLSPGASYNKFLITPTSTGTADLVYDLSIANTPAGFWTHVSDAGDINVYLQDGTTRVACHVVGFNKTNKTGLVFFACGAGTAFYIVYGTGITTPAAGAQYGQNATYESAIVACWGGESLNDVTVFQNNNQSGTPPSIVAGKIGKALSYDGSTQYFEAADAASLRITGDISLMTWVNTTYYVGRILCAKTQNNNIPAPYDFEAGRLVMGNGTVFAQHTATTTPTASIWQHIIHGRAGTTAYHYLQGAANGSGALSTTVTDQGYPLRMGIRQDNEKLAGQMCQTRLYSRMLSSTEAAVHFANQNNQTQFWTVGAQE